VSKIASHDITETQFASSAMLCHAHAQRTTDDFLVQDNMRTGS